MRRGVERPSSPSPYKGSTTKRPSPPSPLSRFAGEGEPGGEPSSPNPFSRRAGEGEHDVLPRAVDLTSKWRLLELTPPKDLGGGRISEADYVADLDALGLETPFSIGEWAILGSGGHADSARSISNRGFLINTAIGSASGHLPNLEVESLSPPPVCGASAIQ